jgi:hypothetical protein
VAIEWAERSGDLLPAGAVRLTFRPGAAPEARVVTVEWE